jgi:hypothetical protein
MNDVKPKPLLVWGACLVYYYHDPTPPSPIELGPALVPLVLWFTFFDPTWFCIKPYSSTVQHVFLIQQKN